jgi:hypothetical protein
MGVWAGAPRPPTPPKIPLQGIETSHIKDVGNHHNRCHSNVHKNDYLYGAIAGV